MLDRRDVPEGCVWRVNNEYGLGFSRLVGLWGSRALTGIMTLVSLLRLIIHIEQHVEAKQEQRGKEKDAI